MCNRYFQEHQLEKLERLYDIEAGSTIGFATGVQLTKVLAAGGAAVVEGQVEETSERMVSSDLYPSYRSAVIRNREGKREITPMHWGLILPWVKDADLAKFTKPNNARDDTIIKSLVEKKGMFYAPMKNARCILPATGWCEWTGKRGSMIANRLSVQGMDKISFAGLYAYRDGFPGLSCTMITTAAEGEAAKYHHRIPVVLLSKEDEDAWLDPAADPMELTKLFKCVPEDLLIVEQRETDQRKKPSKEGEVADSLDI